MRLSPWSGSATRRSNSSALRRRSAFGHAAHAQAVADIVGDRHQREQRKVLEDQRGRPLVRADARHVLAGDAHRAFGRLEKAGDRAQQRGLAAARGAEDREEFAAVDLERDIFDSGEIAEPDRHAVQFDVCAHAPAISMPGYSCKGRPWRATTSWPDCPGHLRRVLRDSSARSAAGQKFRVGRRWLGVDGRHKAGHDVVCLRWGSPTTTVAWRCAPPARYAALYFSAYCERSSANHEGSTGRHHILSIEGPG